MTYLDILDEVALECYYDGTLGYEPIGKTARIGYSSVTGEPTEQGKELAYKLSATGLNSDIKEKPVQKHRVHLNIGGANTAPCNKKKR